MVRDVTLRQECVDLTDAWRTVFTCVCCVDSELRKRQCDGFGLFFFVWAKVMVNSNMNSDIYVSISDNSMLPTLWQQFGTGPFLYEHYNALVHEANIIAAWFEDN